MTEPSQITNEIQTWTHILEQKNNDRIEMMREEMDNKFEAIFRKISTNKNASTVTNPRSEVNEIQDPQPSGNRTNSIGVRASNNENSNFENDDYHIRASKMKDLKHPAKPFFQNESDVEKTILSNEDTDAEEDYHMGTAANRQLFRQSSQNPSDTIGSHADQNLPNLTAKPLDPVNQIVLAIEKLANKSSPQSLFHPKNTLTFNGKIEKMRNLNILRSFSRQRSESNHT